MFKKLGLALGGGGLRGAAHIGILKFLSEKGVEFDYLAGTSAGSIIAGLYASGMSTDELFDWAHSLSPKRVLDFPGLGTLLGLGTKIVLDSLGLDRLARHNPLLRSPMGLIKGERLERTMAQMTGNVSMVDLKIPTAIVATDLLTSRRVIFASPDLADRLKRRMKSTSFYSNVPVAVAIRASTAVPGIFAPRKFRSHLLVDGGIQDNVPADVLALSGSRRVIAVDLGVTPMNASKMDNALEVVLQAIDIMQEEITQKVLSDNATITIRPSTSNVKLTSFSGMPNLMESGYKAAELAWPKIKRLL